MFRTKSVIQTQWIWTSSDEDCDQEKHPHAETDAKYENYAVYFILVKLYSVPSSEQLNQDWIRMCRARQTTGMREFPQVEHILNTDRFISKKFYTALPSTIEPLSGKPKRIIFKSQS